jgi:hypothetical protein
MATDFKNDDTWRVLRIMSEFCEGFEMMHDIGPAITIFGSARTKPSAPEYKLAVRTAEAFGKLGYNIITGGGPGIMEAANKGARKAGVISVGLNINLPFEQKANPYIDREINFRYFFVRKVIFLKYATGSVIFPGGFGTLDEMAELITLVQTRKMNKLPIVLFGRKYWNGLNAWLRKTVLAEGMISPEDLDLFKVTDSIEETVSFIHHRFELEKKTSFLLMGETAEPSE